MGSNTKIVGVAILIPTLIIIGMVAEDYRNQVLYRDNQKYFFFHDPQFLTSSDALCYHWDSLIWNEHDVSYSNTTSGYAMLQYNETTGENWGSSILLQGLLPHGKQPYKKLLVGTSYADAEEESECTFHKDFPVENFNLKTKVMVTNLSYVCNVTGDIPKANVAIELVCAFTYRNSEGDLAYSDFDNPDVNVTGNIKIGITFMQAEWNFTESAFDFINPPASYYNTSPYDGDYHLTLTRGLILNETDTWYSVSVDLGEIISTSFDLLNNHGAKIETIIVKGVQIYVEGIGCSVGAKFDYMQTEVTE